MVFTMMLLLDDYHWNNMQPVTEWILVFLYEYEKRQVFMLNTVNKQEHKECDFTLRKKEK